MSRAERGGIFLRLIGLLVLIAVLTLIYLVRYPLMRFAGEAWVYDDPAIQSDAIVVLGDDNYAGDRASRAAELYRAGLAPLVVASGRLLRPGVGIAELIERDLDSRSVPAASVVKFPERARNTREEAEALRDLVNTRGWKRILVVTSNYHTRRTKFIFDRVFPRSVTVRVTAAKDSEFDPSSWWETRMGQKLLFNELAGFMVAWWELRNNVPQASAMILRSEFEAERAPRPHVPGGRLAVVPYLIGNIPSLVRWGAGPTHTIVCSLPSSPGCSSPTALRSRVFGLGDFHVA